jgi:hypothetical protein
VGVVRKGAAWVVAGAALVLAVATTQLTRSDAPGASSPPAGGAVAGGRLPDLDQEAPSELAVRAGDGPGAPTHRLGFRSAVRNIGAGPLVVEGSRVDTGTGSMAVDQIIDRGEEPPEVIRDVGRMHYAVSPDHSHWHYLQFERYELQRSELRRAGSSDVIVSDRKTGFCLGDRYRATATPLPAAPTQPVYTGSCGRDRPDLLRMREGISVGYGDDYSAFLEGQDLPLDGLPDGRYVLVHRVNLDERLRERSLSNNAASVLFDLRWQAGQPHVRVLATCPDTDRCDDGGGA